MPLLDYTRLLVWSVCIVKVCKNDQNCRLQAMISDMSNDPFDNVDDLPADYKYDPEDSPMLGEENHEFTFAANVQRLCFRRISVQSGVVSCQIKAQFMQSLGVIAQVAEIAALPVALPEQQQLYIACTVLPATSSTVLAQACEADGRKLQERVKYQRAKTSFRKLVGISCKCSSWRKASAEGTRKPRRRCVDVFQRRAAYTRSSANMQPRYTMDQPIGSLWAKLVLRQLNTDDFAFHLLLKAWKVTAELHLANEEKLKLFYGQYNPEKLDSSGEIKDWLAGHAWCSAGKGCSFKQRVFKTEAVMQNMRGHVQECCLSGDIHSYGSPWFLLQKTRNDNDNNDTTETTCRLMVPRDYHSQNHVDIVIFRRAGTEKTQQDVGSRHRSTSQQTRGEGFRTDDRQRAQLPQGLQLLIGHFDILRAGAMNVTAKLDFDAVFFSASGQTGKTLGLHCEETIEFARCEHGAHCFLPDQFKANIFFVNAKLQGSRRRDSWLDTDLESGRDIGNVWRN
eukprot:5385974-Amphidinium_carterae.3